MDTIDFDALSGLFSPLFRHWLKQARIAPGIDPGGRHGIVTRAEDVPEPPASPSLDVRAALCDRLESYAETLGAPAESRAAVARLRDPRACAVLTGQQPGVLGGPLLIAYKTATAIATARRLEERWQRPVVPVFWNHSDDADVDEIRRLHVIDRDNRLVDLECPPVPPRTEISAVAWREELPRLLEDAFAALPQTQFSPSVRDLHEPQASQGPARCFAGAMLRLFGPHGLIVFEPRLARPLWGDLLARGAREMTGIHADLAEESTRLRSEGFDPPLDADSAAVLFRVVDGSRRRLRIVDGGIQEDGSEGVDTVDAVAQRIRREPESFSPGVALRPACQDRIFPTAAYVGGPAELTYLTQLRPVYRRLGVRPPTLLPRLSVTLLEPKIARVADKFQLRPEQLLDLSAHHDTVLAHSLPSGVHDEFRSVRHRIVGEIRALRGLALGVDPALERHTRRFAGKVMKAVRELKQRTNSSHLEKLQVGRSQMDKLILHLTPKGQPQERVLSLNQYLCLFGIGLEARLIDLAGTYPPGHVMWRLA